MACPIIQYSLADVCKSEGIILDKLYLSVADGSATETWSYTASNATLGVLDTVTGWNGATPSIYGIDVPPETINFALAAETNARVLGYRPTITFPLVGVDATTAALFHNIMKGFWYVFVRNVEGNYFLLSRQSFNSSAGSIGFGQTLIDDTAGASITLTGVSKSPYFQIDGQMVIDALVP